MEQTERAKKVIIFFLLLILALTLFLGKMLYTAITPRDLPNKFTSDSTRAQRGKIISADGFHVASTQKLYKAVVNTRNIDPTKKELFIELFCIYSGIAAKEIRERLNERSGSVVLSYNIGPKVAQYLKSLAFELRRLGVFTEYETPAGRRILQGLNVLESGETREYPYGNVLTPLIGYPRKMDDDDGYTHILGIKGIEKYYEEELSHRQNGKRYAPRDVNSYMILNKQSYSKRVIDGLDVQLSIPLTLQIRVEKITDTMKEALDAKEVMVVVMAAKSGKILSLASSNRFYPKSIRRSDYPSLNTGAIEYSFEPGSVIKSITFALLLEHKKINPFDLVNAHNGRFKMGRKIITDEHKYDWLSAENVIVHSSNIGIAQLAQKLDGFEFHQGLKDFGFSRASGIDLPYEKAGSIPAVRQLNHEIYKATASYGYGLRANLMQVVKAYNAFNNHGRLVTPRVTEKLIDEKGKETLIESDKGDQVISAATAARMKHILIKTVQEGTGVKARTPGLEIGGKTGTAHIAYEGGYANRYNSSFVGFANDETRNYTIGVTVVEPKKQHFASLTAVATFKKVVDMMVREGYLEPKITENPDAP